MRRLRFSFGRADSGATAVEFAMIVPAFAALIVGAINLSLLLFDLASLNYAVEKAARCASVDTTTCGDAAAIENYAGSSYYAEGSPDFAFQALACGNSVTGTMDFSLNAVIYSTTIPLSATACFP